MNVVGILDKILSMLNYGSVIKIWASEVKCLELVKPEGYLDMHNTIFKFLCTTFSSSPPFL